ncbi:MAPEG family protein [Roseobacter sp. CCS2]|uniref:MAPEG family protein n=1 Tax=Roseobacter sp. CCS2 TaxID=391593 RepID=UPI0000F3E145|nr:MAPEG family protein [Roseobacter sp. CCS2]EBA12633.1 hypothetical protein RCCS2_15089 [Roseobacter sp. CCS2]
MSMELWSLFAVGGMLFVTIAIQATYMDLTSGVGYALSSRDDPPPKEGVIGERLARAVRNQTEGAAVWMPLVLVALQTDTSNSFTYWASVAMIVGRILYVPFYMLGLNPLRSMAWLGFFFGTPVFIYGLLFA